MTEMDFHLRKNIANLDSVVAKSADNLLVIVLQAIDAFACFTVTHYSLQVVMASPPVVLDALLKLAKHHNEWSGK